LLPSVEGKKKLFPLYRGVACEAMTGWFLSLTPPYGHPSHEGKKKWIPLYKRGGMRSHDGVCSLLSPRPMGFPSHEGEKRGKFPSTERGVNNILKNFI
jgi:hypothetical protein